MYDKIDELYMLCQCGVSNGFRTLLIFNAVISVVGEITICFMVFDFHFDLAALCFVVRVGNIIDDT